MIVLGNNVFVGINSIILRNAYIGDNVIIGAVSVILGNVDSNAVYAGGPEEKIMSLDEFKIAFHNHSSGNSFNENIYNQYQFCYLKCETPLPNSFLAGIIRTGYRQKVLDRYHIIKPIINSC